MFGFGGYTAVEDKKYNTALLPRSKNLNRIMVNSGIKNKLTNIVSERAKEKLKKVFFQENDLPTLNVDDRKYLLSVFKTDIEKTSQLINRDLSHWYKY